MTDLPQDAVILVRLGSAILIGLLVGLQRDYRRLDDAETTFAGTRTFALMGLTGGLAAMVSDVLDRPAVWAAVIIVVGAVIVVGYAGEVMAGDIGATTQVAAIVTVLAGALCYWGRLPVAAAVGVATTLLLAIKGEARRFAATIDREDVIATVKFAAITALILPVLPNRELGPPPIDIINPFNTWVLVVLISGISFLGYVLVKVIGPRRGIGLTGLLGGLASSTAVTISFAQRSRDSEGLERALALAIVVAWTTMYARVAVEVAVTNRSLLMLIALPLLFLGAVAIGHVAWLYLQGLDAETDTPTLDNPFGLTPAITFGALYVVIKIGAHLGHLWLGDAGVYVSSLVLGLADVDAITLSMAELSSAGEIDGQTAGRAIILATMANTVFKGGIASFIGTAKLRRALLPGVAVLVTAGLVAIWLV